MSKPQLKGLWYCHPKTSKGKIVQTAWIAKIKSRSTASARWVDTQTPRTDSDSSLLFVALGKAEPLISTAAHQRFDLDPWPWHTKNRGRRSNGSAVRVLTNTRTDGWTLPSALSPRSAVDKKVCQRIFQQITYSGHSVFSQGAWK